MLLLLSDCESFQFLFREFVHPGAGLVFWHALLRSASYCGAWRVSPNMIPVLVLARTRTHGNLVLLLLSDSKAFLILWREFVHARTRQ